MTAKTAKAVSTARVAYGSFSFIRFRWSTARTTTPTAAKITSNDSTSSAVNNCAATTMPSTAPEIHHRHDWRTKTSSSSNSVSGNSAIRIRCRWPGGRDVASGGDGVRGVGGGQADGVWGGRGGGWGRWGG